MKRPRKRSQLIRKMRKIGLLTAEVFLQVILTVMRRAAQKILATS